MRLRTFLSVFGVLGWVVVSVTARAESAYLPAPDGDLSASGTFGNSVTAPPLAVILPNGLKLDDFAANQDVQDLIFRVLKESDKSPGADYLFQLGLQHQNKLHAAAEVGKMALSLYDIQRRTLETHAGPATLVSDRASFEAVSRCIGEGVTVEGMNYTPHNPDIFSKCVKKLQDEPVTLTSKTGLPTDSLVKQFFSKDEMRELVWTFVGDSKLEQVAVGGKKTAALKAWWGPYTSNKVTATFLGLRGRVDKIVAQADVEIGTNCDKLPAPTSFKWRTDMLGMQEVPIDPEAYREAYKSAEWCSAFKTALATEATAREADLVLTYMTFAAYQGAGNSLMQEALARMTIGLRGRLESWRRDQTANKGTYADIQQKIIEARRSRQAFAAGFLSTPKF